jgi:hypothetical protein
MRGSSSMDAYAQPPALSSIRDAARVYQIVQDAKARAREV